MKSWKAGGEMRRLHNAAGLLTPDGMPLVWLSRLQGFFYPCARARLLAQEQ